MTRLTDEELDATIAEYERRNVNGEFFGVVNKQGMENILYSLKQARSEIEYLKKVCYEKQAALLGSDVEWMKCLAELNKTREELDTLRKSRNHASSLIDCSERLKIAKEAFSEIVFGIKYSQYIPSQVLRYAEEALTKIGELK